MELATIHGTLTMSSREIADLTGKEHKNVLSDIRNMLEKLGKTSADFSADLPDAYGRIQPGFKLDRELTMTLVSGYDIPLRHRVVVKLAELEQKVGTGTLAIPKTLPEALRLAADLAEQKAHVEAKLALAEPKAEALDRISDAEGTTNITVSAKTLQVQPKCLFGHMRQNRWIYRRPGGGGYVAYQDKIQAGYLVHKVTTIQRDDGTDKVVQQVLVTGKGLAKLSQELRP